MSKKGKKVVRVTIKVYATINKGPIRIGRKI